MIFKKKTNDAPKAILTTKKQVTNLRSSLRTQEALLNMKSSSSIEQVSVAADGSLSAQWEYTVLMTEEGLEILAQ